MTAITDHRQPPQRAQLFGVILHKAMWHKHFVPICLVAAFLIRIVWISLLQVQPVSDMRWYYERGMDFAAGKGYSVSASTYWPENLPPAALIADNEYSTQRRPTAYWPVGYPAFLGLLFAIFGPSVLVAKVANVFLYTGILCLAYSIARKMFNSELNGRITLLILSLYPNHIAYSSLLATEILFLFLLLLAIALLTLFSARLWMLLASGGVFGLACLVKPQAIFVPAVIFAVSVLAAGGRQELLKQLVRHHRDYYIPRPRSWRLNRDYQDHFDGALACCVIVYIALGLTILPWIVRNYYVFNDFVFISNNGGINLLVGNNPYASGAYGHHEQIASMLSDVKNERERDMRAHSIAVDYAVSHAWDAFRLWPRKLWYLYSKDVEGISWNENGMDISEGSVGQSIMLTLKAIAQLYYMFIVAVFVLFFISRLHQHRKKATNGPVPMFGLWIGLYFTLLCLLTFGDSRFHFPVMPWMVMYAGAFVSNRG